MKVSKLFQGFVIGAVIAFVISGTVILLSENSVDLDYNSRFYKQALSDDLLIQLYMFPFNENDVVTMYYEGENNEVIYINHTEPNPDFLPFRFVYNYHFHFDRELTIEEYE